MGDEAMRVYISTRDGVTRQSATPGSAADRRFARSGRWRLVESPGVDGDEALAVTEAAAREGGDDGEPGTFDAPRCPSCSPHEAHGAGGCERCELGGEPCKARADDPIGDDEG